MIEQAGIYTVELIENKGVSVTWCDVNAICEITSSGANIIIENEQEIKLTIDPIRNKNNKLSYNYNLQYLIYDNSKESQYLIKQIKRSIYGWLLKITFYNGDVKFINEPLRFDNSNIDNNVSNSYSISLKNVVLTRQKLISFEFSPLALNPIFWVDSLKDVITSDVLGTLFVDEWKDQSSNNNDAIQLTGIKRPTYDNISVNSDGTQWMDTPLIFNDSLIWSVMYVIDDYTRASLFDFIIGGQGTRNLLHNRNGFFAYRAENSLYGFWNGVGNTVLTSLSELEDNNKHYIIWKSDGVNIHLYLDGNYRGYITPISTKLYVDSIMQGYTKTGLYIPTSKYFEFVFFNSFLDENETNNMVYYFNNKYSL